MTDLRETQPELTDQQGVDAGDPFDVTDIERSDILVVTYTCPLGDGFDKFVARSNLHRVPTTPCINHPDQDTTIHSSRPMN